MRLEVPLEKLFSVGFFGLGIDLTVSSVFDASLVVDFNGLCVGLCSYEETFRESDV